MTDTFLSTLNLIKGKLPKANIYNLWQIANEVNAQEVKDQALAKVILLLQKELPTFRSTSLTSSPLHLQFSTLFSFQNHALNFFNQGFVLICDDITTWEQLIKLTLPNQIHSALDWICTIYNYVIEQTQFNAVSLIRHPYLLQDEELKALGVEWEYASRRAIEKSNTHTFPDHPLFNCFTKISPKTDFYTVLQKTLEKLPTTLCEPIASLAEYTKILDGSPFCVDWFRKSLYLKKGAAQQIRLGLHEALKFDHDQTIFCLKHNQIKPKLSQSLLENPLLISLDTQLLKWKKQHVLNVLCYSTDILFTHPLIQIDSLQKYKEPKITLDAERPIVNPPISSRPTIISASGFNLLMQDPYGFYARYILKLNPLERITDNFFAKKFGLAAHKVMEIYLKDGFDAATKYIHSIDLNKPVILWKNKLLRILSWAKDQIHQLNPKNIQSEYNLQTTLHTITLKARLDALLSLETGNLVVNFKTGTPPTKTDVVSGYIPQLAIEMFLAQKSYESETTQVQAEFWQLKGTQPPGIISSSLALSSATAQAELEKIIFHYFMKNSPFLTCPWPSKTPKCNEYKNLERLV